MAFTSVTGLEAVLDAGTVVCFAMPIEDADQPEVSIRDDHGAILSKFKVMANSVLIVCFTVPPGSGDLVIVISGLTSGPVMLARPYA